MIDRLPPSNIDSERALLGSVLIDQAAIVDVMEIVQAPDFSRQSHGIIFSAMLRLFERGTPADVVLLAEELERAGELEAIGGAAYLSQLGHDAPTSIHAVQYAQVVAAKAVSRRLIGAAGRIAAIGYEDGSDIQEALDRAEVELRGVQARERVRPRDFTFARHGMGYLLTWPDHKLELAFSRLHRRSLDTTAEVRITCKLERLNLKDGHVSMGRQNLSAPKGRMDFARGLQRRTDAQNEHLDWEDIIERSFVAVLVAEQRGEPILEIGDGDEAPVNYGAYCIDPIAPRGVATIIFAPQESAKSYLGLACAVSVKVGREIIPGVQPAVKGNVLYLDWETNKETVEARIRKIARGLEIPPPRIGYRRCHAPLADDAEELSTWIRDHDVELVIIDSVGMAVGSQGEYGDQNESVLRFFEAIRCLGQVTTICIDHVSKQEFIHGRGKGGTPYGSIYKLALARSAWEVRNVVKGDDDLSAALFHAKVNDSRKMAPIGYRLVWSADGVDPKTVHFETSAGGVPTGGSSIADQAVAIIGHGRASTSKIAQSLGTSVDSVRKSLNRDDRFARVGSDWMLVDDAPIPMNATTEP